MLETELELSDDDIMVYITDNDKVDGVYLITGAHELKIRVN
jgi:hypothetical protein